MHMDVRVPRAQDALERPLAHHFTFWMPIERTRSKRCAKVHPTFAENLVFPSAIGAMLW